MKSFSEMRTQIDEVLSKSDDMSKWISDFLDSDAPQFKGKSKEKKMQMAKAAYYAAQKEGVMQPNGTDKVGRLKEETVWNKAAKEVKTIKDRMMQRQLNDIARTLDQIGRAPNSLANIMGNNLIDKLNRQLRTLDTDVRDGVIQKFKKVGLMNEHLEEGENKQMKGKDPCWKDYEMVGTKKKNGKEVPNCVPKEDYEVKHLDSYKDGQQAAKDGKKYSDNPHPKNSKAHLNWSKGHNTQRANKMNEADIPLSDKEKNKMLSNKDKSTLGKIHDLMKKQKKEGYKSDAQRKAVWASRNEEVNPEAAAKEAKKAQMAAKHASEKESLAKKHEREKESMKESSASKLVQTKLGNMDRKNVRIPSPAERKAEMEKRKQMKEDIDMLSFEEYLEEDMRIAKASSFAKKHAGDMKTAVKKIEGIRKGLTNHPKVKDALKKANEELSENPVVGMAARAAGAAIGNKIVDKAESKMKAKEKVNELSKGTLKSYADKAHQDSLNKAYDAAHTGDRKESDKLHKQATKRADNVKKADMKASMKKEENLDELSKKTLGSYVKKASFNAAQSAYQAGGSNGNIAKLQPHMDKLNKRTAGVNKATDKLTKEDVDVEIETLKSYKDFINEMQGGRYVHKGTRYGGSAQVDHDHEKDFGIDNEKEKFKRLLQKKKPEQKPAQSSTVKKGRGRPMGSKSGARN